MLNSAPQSQTQAPRLERRPSAKNLVGRYQTNTNCKRAGVHSKRQISSWRRRLPGLLLWSRNHCCTRYRHCGRSCQRPKPALTQCRGTRALTLLKSVEGTYQKGAAVRHSKERAFYRTIAHIWNTVFRPTARNREEPKPTPTPTRGF